MRTSARAFPFFGEPVFWFLGMRSKRKKIDLSTIKRVMVARLDNIGDVVMTSAFLRELRGSLPKAWITLVVRPEMANLVELCPYVNEVLVYDCEINGRLSELRRHGRALVLALRYLWPRRFDISILPRWDVDLYHGIFLLYFSGAPYRVSYSEALTSVKRQVNKGFDHLLTHAIGNTKNRHEVEHNLDVLRFLGGTVQTSALEVWTSAEDTEFANEILTANNLSQDELLIAFGLGAGERKRTWPIKNFLELGNILKSDYNARILVIGGKKENQLGTHLQRRLGKKVINVAGQATLRQTAALLKHCHLYVGNDSGPMHLAAAAGITVVEISCHPRSGPILHDNSPERFGPWRVQHQILQPDEGLYPCSGACISDRDHCILQISLQKVRAAVLTQLSNLIRQ